MPVNTAIAIGTSVAISEGIRQAEESSNTNLAMKMESCKTLNTKKETSTCIKQLIQQKNTADTDQAIVLLIILVIIFTISAVIKKCL